MRRVEDIEVVFDDEAIRQCLADKTDKLFSFKPHLGWVGHIEI